MALCRAFRVLIWAFCGARSRCRRIIVWSSNSLFACTRRTVASLCVFAIRSQQDITTLHGPPCSSLTRTTASGFEVQIDNTGAPDGLAKHTTGAIYAVNYPGDPNPDPALPAAQAGDFVNPLDARVLAWNQYNIEVNGDVIKVNLNGVDTARYTNT